MFDVSLISVWNLKFKLYVSSSIFGHICSTRPLWQSLQICSIIFVRGSWSECSRRIKWQFQMLRAQSTNRTHRYARAARGRKCISHFRARVPAVSLWRVVGLFTQFLDLFSPTKYKHVCMVTRVWHCVCVHCYSLKQLCFGDHHEAGKQEAKARTFQPFWSRHLMRVFWPLQWNYRIQRSKTDTSNYVELENFISIVWGARDACCTGTSEVTGVTSVIQYLGRKLPRRMCTWISTVDKLLGLSTCLSDQQFITMARGQVINRLADKI